MRRNIKRRSKPPRKFGRRKVKQKARVRQENCDRQPSRMSEDAIAFMEEISPGFAAWYRVNYDESGRYVGEKIKELFG